MPLPTKDLDLENAAETTSSPSRSPPTLQQSIQNAYSVDQSQLAKGLSTSPQHQRIKSVISCDTSTIDPPIQNQQRPVSSPSALLGNVQVLSSTQGSYFISQPGTSAIEARSPANKRAPASRSSHGIATSSGPPPALITQRSYHGDPWRNPVPTDQPNLPATSYRQPQTKEGGDTLARRNSSHSRTGGKAMLDAMNSSLPERGATSNTIPYKKRYDTDEDDNTLRARHLTNGADRASHNGRQEDDHSYSSHEDLFLHLARADSEAGNNSDSTKKTGRRGSDFGTSTSQPVRTSRQFRTRPASSGRDFGGERSEEKAFPWSRGNQCDTPMNSRFSSPREQKYAASAHPLDQGNQRYLQSDLSSKPSFTTLRVREYPNRVTSPEFPASSGRRQSITESRSATRSRTYKPSTRSHISVSGNHYDSSPIAQGTHLNQSIHPNDTESTTSTTAPSTVWDELDDLKSRIRKLELTGKLPSSSGAAIASVTNDRPRTATTTMTTASSSPKNNRPRNASPEASTVKGTDTSSLHPLLHSALAKAKPLIDSKAFTALERTASDALTLAALTSATKSIGRRTSIQDPSRANDRQLRRKADSMCRSLTELCIALSEEKASPVASTSKTRTTSNENPQENTIHASPPEDPVRLRASSQDPDRPSSRIISRLEARRTSLLASNASPSTTAQTNNQMDSPSNQQTHTSTPAQTNPSTSRSSMLHRRRTADSNADTVTLSTHSSRSLSRSRQEQRPSLPTRISREYTSQHPLPTLTNSNHQQKRSPSILSSSLQKKSYFPYYGSSNTSSNINSPVTPLNNIQPGNRRYLSSERERQTTPGSADDSQRRAEERQQRIASLGQYSSGRRLRLVEGEQG
ncbi:MAG: hypothetical protein Q9213_001954 [Squamulea squamosa]